MALVSLAGLISYWKLDETSGNALDAHGSNPLTDVNTVGAAAGKLNGARDFVHANAEYFVHTSNSDFRTGDIDFTFALWAKSNVVSNANGMLFFKDVVPASPEYGMEVFNSRFDFEVWAADGDGAATGELLANTFGDITAGVWYFVVAWHDSVANTLNIQVNGGAVDSLSYSAGVWAGSADFKLGNDDPSFGFSWDGQIDEVSFWKRVLTAAERTALYNNGYGLAYPFVDDAGLGRIATAAMAWR
jgi:hypothetical protein